MTLTDDEVRYEDAADALTQWRHGGMCPEFLERQMRCLGFQYQFEDIWLGGGEVLLTDTRTGESRHVIFGNL